VALYFILSRTFDTDAEHSAIETSERELRDIDLRHWPT